MRQRKITIQPAALELLIMFGKRGCALHRPRKFSIPHALDPYFKTAIRPISHSLNASNLATRRVHTHLNSRLISLGEIPRNSSKQRTSQGISLSKRFYRVVTNLSSRSLLMMNRLGSSEISTNSILYKSFKICNNLAVYVRRWDMRYTRRERELCAC